MITYPIRLLFVGLYRFWLGVKQTLFRPSGSVLELNVSDIPDQPSPVPFLQGGLSLFDYRRMLKRAASDPTVEGVILRIDGLGDTGFGTIEELRELLRKFARSGKFTVAYLNGTDTRGYYLASICNRIFLQPSAALGPLGLHVQQPFLRGTLEKLGIEPKIERVGDYKSAADTVNRKKISPEHKEMMNWILDELYEEITGEIHARRGIEQEAVKDLFDEGFLDAASAQEAGLVDELGHQHELEEWVEDRTSHASYTPRAGEDYAHLQIPSDVSWRPPERIAVLYADGPIHEGRGTLIPNSTVGARTVLDTLKDLRDSGAYDGILFRVNSPGGSAVASDTIAREIQRMRNREETPVVASMGDVAGSGGYYISVLADPIYANRTTITGSIGVVMGKFDVSDLQQKMDYRTHDLTRGKRADMISPSRGWKSGEKKKLSSMMEGVYDRFVSVVQEGREKDRDAIEDVAQGKVWTGRQARENGLIDETGGFDDALRHLRSRMGLSGDTPIKLDPKPARHFQLLGSIGFPLSLLKSVFGKTLGRFLPMDLRL